MRTIKYIVVHCTAGYRGQTVADVMAEFNRKGWKNPGYHYLVMEDGRIHQLLDDSKTANGVSGYNSVCVHVAYTGGVDRNNGFKPLDNRTDAQKRSLRALLRRLREKYPKAVIQGHRDFPGVAKDCPSFDAKREYRNL